MARVAELELQLLDVTNKKDLAEKEILALKRKASFSDEEIRGLNVALEKSRLEINAAKKYASEVESYLTEKSNKMSATMKQNTELTVNNAAKDQEITGLHAQAEKDRATIAALTANISDLEASLKQVNDELAMKTNKTNDMAVATALSEKQTTALKAQTIADSEIITKLKNQIADLQASSSSTAADLKACSIARAELDKKLVSSLALNKMNDEALSAGRDRIASLETTLAKSNSELAAAKTNIANLKSSAEKEEKKISALTSQTLKDANEIKSLKQQVNDLTVSLSTASSEVKSLKANLQKSTDMLNASAKQVSALTADQVKGKEQRAALQSSLAALKDVEEAQRKQIAELQLLLAQKEQSLDELDQKMINVRAGSLHVLVDHTGTGRAAKVSAGCPSSSSNVRGSGSLETSTHDGPHPEYIALCEKVCSLEEQVSDLTVLCSTKDKEKAELEERAKSTALTMAQMAARNTDLMASLKKSVEDLKELSNQLANANAASNQSELSANETISALQTQLQKCNNTVAALEQQVKELSAAKAAMSASIEALEVEGKKSSDMIAVLTKNIGGLVADKAAAGQKIEDLTTRSCKAEDDVAECNKRLVQVEAALNQAINDTSTLKRSYDELMASAKVTATTNQSERDRLLSQLQSNMDEAASWKQRIEYLEDKLKKANDEFVDLQRQFIELTNSNALAKSAHAKDVERYQLQTKQQEDMIATLKKHIAELELQQKRDSISMSTLTANVDDMRRQVESQKKQYADSQIASAKAVASLESALTKATAELSVLSTNNNTLSTAKLAADAEIQALQAQCKSSSESISAMKSRIADSELKQLKADEDIRTLTASKAAADARINDFENAAEQAKSTIAVLQKRVTELETQGVHSDDQTKTLTKRLNDAIAAKTAADARIATLEARCEKDAVQIGTMEKNAVVLTAELKMAKTELAAANKRVSEASDARLAAEKEKEALKIQGQKDREDLKSLNKRVGDLEGNLKQTIGERTALSQQLMDETSSNAAAKIAAAKEADNLKAQCKKLQDELLAFQQRVQELEIALKADKDQFLALTKNHNNLTTTSTEEIATLKRLLAELETKATAGNREIAALNQKVNELSLINENEERRVVSLEGQIAAGNKDYETLKSDFDALHANKVAADKRIAQLAEQGKNDALALQALQMQIVECKTALATIEKCKADLDATLRASDGEVSALKMKEKLSADEISALKQLVESGQAELKTQNATVVGLEAQKLKGEETIATITQQLADIDKRLLDGTDAANQRIGVLEGQGKSYEANIGLLKQQLEDQKAATASMSAQYQSLKESSAAAMGMLETKSKTDDATIASLRAQAKLDSENIASLTDQLMSLASEFQSFKSDAEKAIAALQSKAKNDNTEIANLHAQNVTDNETIASLTQQLNLRTQESLTAKESAAATINDLQLKGKRDDEEIEALRDQLSALQASSSQTITNTQAQLKKSKEDNKVVEGRIAELEGIYYETDRAYLSQTPILSKYPTFTTPSLIFLQSLFLGIKLVLEKNVASLETSLKASADEIIALKRQISELESTIRAITDENEQVNHMASF